MDLMSTKPNWRNLTEYKKWLMDRTLEITNRLYKQVVVEYDEYQRALSLIDNASVKIAFEYFDYDGNGIVTKGEMMNFTEKDPKKKRNLKTDPIATTVGFKNMLAPVRPRALKSNTLLKTFQGIYVDIFVTILAFC